MHLDSVSLARREEDAALHHRIHQVLLLVLTLTASNTLATITITHGRAVTPLEGAGSAGEDRRGIIYRTSIRGRLQAQQLVVQVLSLAEALSFDIFV